MPPKNDSELSKPKSTVVVQSAYLLAGGEQTEITAQISVPEDGGWGWVVMVTSFINIFIIDGVVFTFGALFPYIRDDMELQDSLVALVNSVAFGVYFTAGPIASAIINRFGFRECTMAGSIISSIAVFSTYFATNYFMLFIFYGVLNGFGACLIAMASNLVVGFYFEKLRNLVLAVACSGASAGVMILYSVNAKMTKLVGWRGTTLFHAGLIGIVYFLAMTYRPLVSLFVTKTEDLEVTKVTYLPNVADKQAAENVTAPERIFQAISSAHFPTVATVMETQPVIEAGPSTAPGATSELPGTSARSKLPSTESHSKSGATPRLPETQAGPSTALAATRRISIAAHSPGGVKHRQIKSLQKIATATRLNANRSAPLEVVLDIKPAKKTGLCRGKCCQWEKNIPEARPMYRDDAFYGGDVSKLAVYKKSLMEIPPETRTGLEYQMAVTRAATTADMEDKRGLCTTAFKRILVTMMDPTLLRKSSFLVLCFSGFCTYSGFLVPYIFLEERNKLEGVDPRHCTMLISVIGATNLVGRVTLGILACKLDPLIIYSFACTVSGVATIASNFSFDVSYQYTCGIVFGFFITCLVSLRSMILVKFYGIDMLTNATGVMVVFQGIGGAISTPLGSLFKDLFGYAGAFYLSGAFMLTSGLVLIPVKMLVDREKAAEKKLNGAIDKTEPKLSLNERLKKTANKKTGV